MKNIIACIDNTDISTSVSDYSSWASLRLDAPLELLHVLDKSEYPVWTNLSGSIGLGSREALLRELAELDERRGRLALEQGKKMLDSAKERAIADGVSDPITRQRHGSLVECLLEAEEDTRLVVLGKHDENLGAHIGSRLESVVRSLHRPILVCPPAFKTPERIMIAFDGSNTTRKAVEMVGRSPLFQGFPCHVVTVGEESENSRSQLQWAAETLEKQGFEVTTSLVRGDVEPRLNEYCQTHNIDIMIMGAYGHSVIRRFLVGSTSTSVIRNARIPVLLLR